MAQFIDRILKQFSCDQVGLEDQIRAFSVLRVAFGLILFHHYLDVLGYSILSDNPSVIIYYCILGCGLSFLIVFGIFTRLALVALIFALLLKPPFSNSLGDQVAILMAWALFLVQGRRTLTLANVALARALVVIGFWGICISALAYHFRDPFWLQGNVLQIFFTTPYINDFWAIFADLQNRNPQMYNWLCRAGLIVQGFWELLILPLFFFKLGRVFLFLQGMAFFLFSIIFVNLGYLPKVEILLWLFLFWPYLIPTRFLKSHGTSHPIFSRFHRLTLVAFSLVVFGFNIDNFVGINFSEYFRIRSSFGPTISRLAGQGPINVFNQADLYLGSTYLVLSEVDASGVPQRVIPYLDQDGARLDWMNNAYLYFSHSLRWHRMSDERRFNSDGSFSEETLRLIHAISRLNYCMGFGKSRRIRADLFRRQMEPWENQYRWGVSQRMRTEWIEFSPDSVSSCYWTFVLPPGHFGGSRREQETLTNVLTFDRQ